MTMAENENQDRSNLSLVQLIELNKKEKELEENLSIYTNDQNVKVKSDIEKMKKIDKFFEQANQPYSGVQSMNPGKMLEEFKKRRHELEY